MYSTSILAIGLSTGSNTLDLEFHSNEAIMEVMNLMEKPWETNHHQSYFLPNKDSHTIIAVDPTMERNFHWYKDTLNMHDAFFRRKYVQHFPNHAS